MDFHWLTPRSHRVLVPIALLTLLSLVYVESGLKVQPSPWHAEMLRASELSMSAFQHLKQQRLERGVFVDPINDPAQTALIGQEFTQITTDRGYLEAKLATVNPNFAAVVVDMLHEVGVQTGDCVALAMTGSFPALNLSTLAAVETLGIRPVLVSSVGASNYGATDPFFTWLDMEKAVVDAGIFTTRSVAASLGGGNDIGRGLSPKGRQLLEDAAERNSIPLISTSWLEESIRWRMRLYREGCGEQPISAYINVGGGVASLGHSLTADLIPNGASLRLPRRNYPTRGALLRFAEEGVPVIHLLNVRQIRDRYGLDPVHDTLPLPGQGAVFGELRYDLTRTFVVTALLVLGLVALFLFDRRNHQLGQPEPEQKT